MRSLGCPKGYYSNVAFVFAWTHTWIDSHRTACQLCGARLYSLSRMERFVSTQSCQHNHRLPSLRSCASPQPYPRDWSHQRLVCFYSLAFVSLTSWNNVNRLFHLINARHNSIIADLIELHRVTATTQIRQQHAIEKMSIFNHSANTQILGERWR